MTPGEEDGSEVGVKGIADDDGASEADVPGAGDEEDATEAGLTASEDEDGASEADVRGSEDEEPEYKVVFEGRACIGAGRCAEVSSNWRMDVETGLARPVSYFLEEQDLDHNLEAARVCPAKKGDGAIRVVDRSTGEVVEHEDEA